MRTTERVALWCAFSLTALFVVAELSPPGPLVLIAGLNFAFASIAWVAVLHRQWRTGYPPLPKLGLIWTSIGLGLLAVVVGVWLKHRSQAWEIELGSILQLAGVLVEYVGLGLAIVRLRSWVRNPGDGPVELVNWFKARRDQVVNKWSVLGPVLGFVEKVLGVISPRKAALSPLRLLAVVGLQVLCIAGGMLALGDDPAWLALGLLIVGVLPFPMVLGLLSEHALRWSSLTWAQSGWKRLVVGLVGLLGVFLVIHHLASQTRYPEPMVLGLVALVGLVAAIVTGTLGDVAVVLLLLALLGVSAPTTAGIADPWPQDTHVLVALGDSYMSGEGAQQFIDGTNTAGVDECRRARTAWPVLVSERQPFDGLAFLACSGAEAKNLRTAGRDGFQPAPEAQYPSEGTQLETYRSHFKAIVPVPALVVLSVGGNDAGFSTIGATCMAPGSCGEHPASDLAGPSNMDRVENRLRQAYAEVRSTFPTTPVVVIPYPNPLYTDPDPTATQAPCAQAPLSTGDVKFVTGLLAALDDRVAKAAKDFGFFYADTMQNALANEHLQLCDPQNNGHPGLNFISARAVGGISGDRFNPNSWKHGSLHPNERGHAALARTFEAWLAAQGHGDEEAGLAALRAAYLNFTGPTKAPVDERYLKIAAADKHGDCATISPGACTANANAWAIGQVGHLVLRKFGWILLLLVGGWILGFSFASRPT